MNYSPPEDQGVDSDKLGKLISHIKKNKLDIRSIIVARNDSIVLEAYFHPFSRKDKTLVASVVKSITSALIGIAIEKGIIKDENQNISDFFPEINFKQGKGGKREISIKHLLTMSSGMSWNDGTDQAEMMARSDCAGYVLSRPLTEKPGTVFNYNSGGAHLLSVVLTMASGMPTSEFAQKYLFEPLGITDFDWKVAADGVSTGGNLLFLKPIDMLKLGLLYLHGGNWEGRQVVPAAWVAESTKNQIKPPWDRPGESLGYGFLWWNAESNNKPGYFSADGYGGQIIAVVPENTEGMAELFDVCRESENPHGTPSEILPLTASKISNKTYYLQPNASNLKSLRLVFTDTKEAALTLEYKERIITIPVGLDNLYRMCRVPRLIEKVEYFYDFIGNQVHLTVFRKEFPGTDLDCMGTLSSEH